VCAKKKNVWKNEIWSAISVEGVIQSAIEVPTGNPKGKFRKSFNVFKGKNVKKNRIWLIKLCKLTSLSNILFKLFSYDDMCSNITLKFPIVINYIKVHIE
jgi:hypothetical protein